MPPDISPMTVIREAIRVVPAVKYALAVGGVLSVVALVKIYGLEPKIAFFGLIITFAFMGIMLVFAHATKLHGSSLAKPAMVFVWFTLVMFMLISA
jgi:hypothetical protein